MNKSELIAAVSKESGLTQAEAGRAVNGVLTTITKTLKSGGALSLVGFGTFKVTKRAARTGRNPTSGDKIQIPARNSPVFTAGKGLKDAVN